MRDPDLFSTDEPLHLTVSEVNARVRSLLETSFPELLVEGEITGWKIYPGSGHVYLSLKDEGGTLGAVIWASSWARIQRTLSASVRDGDQVVAKGKLTVFEKRGQYQLNITGLRPAGAGALFERFQKLKEKLKKEGLFDESRKRPIPELPRAIGVVTSPTGAVIRDILHVLERRAPGLPVFVWPARVQGTGAAAEIVRGVRALGDSGMVDVVIVARGGGSMEDLWEFNDEALAREVVRCAVPVISAVGHETDFTICDFAADLRAPTPSAAAELVSRDRGQVAEALRAALARMERTTNARLRETRLRLQGILASHGMRLPEARLRDAQQQCDDLAERLDAAMHDRLAAARQRLLAAQGALVGHDPALILRKGYAVVRDEKTGNVIASAQQAKTGMQIDVAMHDGVFGAEVTRNKP